MHPMPPRPRFDLAACAEEFEFHGGTTYLVMQELRGRPPALWRAIFLL